MKMPIKLLCMLLAMVLIFPILTACSDEPPVLPIKTPSATATHEIVSGGELIMPMPENANIDNPLIVNTEEMLSLYSLIFESLISVDDITGRLSPELAETWTCDTETGKIWTLNLRKNVLWHNGTAFTADDFVYTYNKLLAEISGELAGHTDTIFTVDLPLDTTAPEESDMPTAVPTNEPTAEPTTVPTTAPTTVPTTAPTTIPTTAPTTAPTPTADVTSRPTRTPRITPSPTPDPTYARTEADASYYSYHASRIEAVEAIDSYTLKVTMKEAGISSLYALTIPVLCKNAEGETLIGTGAYKLQKATDSRVALVVNSSWWKQLPKITSIIFDARVNNETALASYEAGQLNFVPTSFVSAGKYREEGVTNVIDIMTQNAEFIAYNYDNVLLNDTAIRKAITTGIDISGIISNVYMSRAQACDVPIAPDSYLYNTKSKVVTYDTEKAKSILAEAGYVDKNNDGILEDPTTHQALSFTLLVSESSDNTLRRSAAERIASDLSLCGIEIIVESEYYSLSSVASESNYIKRLYAKEFDLVLTGVNLSRDSDLRSLFTTDGKKNFGGINDAELVVLANSISSAADETAMRTAAYAFQDKFIESMPFTMLYFRKNSIVYSAELLGVGTVREPDILTHIADWYFYTTNGKS